MAKKNRRRIDESVGKMSGNMKSKFLLVPSMKIKTWKALFVVVFAAGFAAAMVWSAYNSWYIGSDASTSGSPGVVSSGLPVVYPSGPSGPKPPGPSIISDIHVSEITTSSAVISWKTNQPYLSQVQYGKDTNYELQGMTDGTHLTIWMLEPNTTYHFRIRVRPFNSTTWKGTTSDQTFKTK